MRQLQYLQTLYLQAGLFQCGLSEDDVSCGCNAPHIAAAGGLYRKRKSFLYSYF